MNYGIADKSPFTVVGANKVGDVAASGTDQIDGNMEWFDGGGTQSGSHPAKTQSKTLRFIE